VPGSVIVSMVTHEVPEQAVSQAMQILEGAESIKAAPLVMQIIEA